MSRHLFRTSLLALSLSTVGFASAAMAAPDVVVSIKPLHSIAAAVMEGIGEPQLLIKGAASPHTYSLRPSDAADIENADVVFWAGPELEAFLEKPLASLADGETAVALMNAPGVKLLPPREDGQFEPHDHDHEHGHEEGHADDDHDHEGEHADTEHGGEDHDEHHAHEEEVDPHFWLDPENARAAAATIVSVLSAKDPENAAAYASNAAAFDEKLVQLEDRIGKEVAPLADKPFIVFHDAYQYFERRFGLSAVGSVTVNPQTQPSAARVYAIEEKIKSLGTVCIFTEPQFAPRLIRSLSEETGARSGELDPIGAAIDAGPEMYETLLESLAGHLNDCLSSS